MILSWESLVESALLIISSLALFKDSIWWRYSGCLPWFHPKIERKFLKWKWKWKKGGESREIAVCFIYIDSLFLFLPSPSIISLFSLSNSALRSSISLSSLDFPSDAIFIKLLCYSKVNQFCNGFHYSSRSKASPVYELYIRRLCPSWWGQTLCFLLHALFFTRYYLWFVYNGGGEREDVLPFSPTSFIRH